MSTALTAWHMAARAYELWLSFLAEEADARAGRLQVAEHRLRDILQLVAGATDEGGRDRYA